MSIDEYNESTELPRKFDIVMEMEKALDDIFSGEYDNLRYRKFIFKRK